MRYHSWMMLNVWITVIWINEFFSIGINGIDDRCHHSYDIWAWLKMGVYPNITQFLIGPYAWTSSCGRFKLHVSESERKQISDFEMGVVQSLRSWESQILGLVSVIVSTRHQKMKPLCLCCMHAEPRAGSVPRWAVAKKCTKTRYQGEHPEFDHWPEVWSIWKKSSRILGCHARRCSWLCLHLCWFRSPIFVAPLRSNIFMGELSIFAASVPQETWNPPTKCDISWSNHPTVDASLPMLDS